MREQSESFAQDRLGNVEREPSEILSRDGQFNPDTAVDAAGQHVIYELGGAAEAHPVEFIVEDTSGSENVVNLLSASTDDTGSIISATQIGANRTVAANAVEKFEYFGEPVTDDAIAISVDGSANVKVGVYSHHKEYRETDTEQTETPS